MTRDNVIIIIIIIITIIIILQQVALKYVYKLLDINTSLYCRYKPVPMLESADKFLYSDRLIILNKTVHFNRSDTVLIDRENVKQLLS